MPKKTALYDLHVASGAKMVEFAGFYMPVEYSGITREHLCVRTGIGLFDVSHMGQIRVEGNQAFDFLQTVLSNDLGLLKPGKAQYTCIPNGLGGIVDDLLVYQLQENEFLLVVNAANRTKDWDFLKNKLPATVRLSEESDSRSLIALQGPKAARVLQTLTRKNLSLVKPFEHITCQLDSVAGQVLLSRTGYTGEDGFEISLDRAHTDSLWKQLMQAGEAYDIQAIGLGARDTLRLEAGLCLYGNDIDDTTSPLEAGLGWITKLHKPYHFTDKQFLIAQKEHGIKKKLVRFILSDRGIPRTGYPILNHKGNIIGKVSSGTISPGLKKGIGMGYVPRSYAIEGKEILIDIRGRGIKGNINNKSFIKSQYGYS